MCCPIFAAPDNIRLGIAPLYNSFADIHTAVMQMKRVVEERHLRQLSHGDAGGDVMGAVSNVAEKSRGVRILRCAREDMCVKVRI